MTNYPRTLNQISESKTPYLVWVEVNDSSPQNVEKVIDGLLQWSRSVEGAIVSTVEGSLDVCSQISDALPWLHMVAGVKTDSYRNTDPPEPADFVDPDLWSRVAEDVNKLHSAGFQEIILENESLIKPWVADPTRKGEPDLHAILPEVSVVWYPAIAGESNVAQDGYLDGMLPALYRIGSWSVDTSESKPKALNYGWSRANYWRLRAVKSIAQTRNATMPIFYFLGPDTDGYRDDEVADTRELISTGQIGIIYPGAARLLESAVAMRPHFAAMKE